MSENPSSRFRGSVNIWKSNLKLRTSTKVNKFTDEDIKSLDAQVPPAVSAAPIDSKSTHKLGADNKSQRPLSIPFTGGQSRSQAHTANTNQRLKPAKFMNNEVQQVVDGTQTEHSKLTKTIGMGAATSK